jgi:hypothetical protein
MAQTTTRVFPYGSRGALEVTMVGHLKRVRNVRLYIFLTLFLSLIISLCFVLLSAKLMGKICVSSGANLVQTRSLVNQLCEVRIHFIAGPIIFLSWAVH